MGAWGQGVFEDDAACDWLDQLAGSGKPAGSKAIEKAIAAALKAKPGRLENDEASMALAAAEVVSAARGHPHADLPREATEWLQLSAFVPQEELTKRSIQAVERIREDSELAELWAEAKELGAWKRGIGNLLVRLQRPANVRAAKPKPPAKKKASKAKPAALPSPRMAIAALKKKGVYIVTTRGAAAPDWCTGSGAGAKEPLEDADMEHLALFPALKQLKLSKFQVTDAGVRHLARMKQLVQLELVALPLTDACASIFDNFSRLESLNLADTQIGDVVLERVAKMPELFDLNLSQTKVTDAGVRHLARCQKLRLVNLKQTAISDSSLRVLATFSAAMQLVLRGTKITSRGIAHLKPLAGLQMLLLDNTLIDDSACATIAGFAQLDWLNLEGTRITGAGLKRLTVLKQLEHLNLSGTALTDDDVPTILQFPENADIIALRTGITARGKQLIAAAGRHNLCA
jgi:hypothetical protein